MNTGKFQPLVSFLLPGALFLVAVGALGSVGIHEFGNGFRIQKFSLQEITLAGLPLLAAAYIAGMTCYHISFYCKKSAFKLNLSRLVAEELKTSYSPLEVRSRLIRFGAPQSLLVLMERAYSDPATDDLGKIAHYMRSVVLLRSPTSVGDQLDYSWQLMRTLWTSKIPLNAVVVASLAVAWSACTGEEGSVAMMAMALAVLSLLARIFLSVGLVDRSESQTSDVLRYFMALELNS